MAEAIIGSIKDKLEDLDSELALLNARLGREIHRHRMRSMEPGSYEFEGLFPFDEQFDSILDGLAGEDAIPDGDPLNEHSQIALLEAELKSRRSGVQDGRHPTRMDHLYRVLQLVEFDAGVIVLCLAPELDSTYELLFAYLQDDISKKQPTVELAMRVLTDSLEERVQRRLSFSSSATLVKYGLIQLADDPYGKTGSILTKCLSLDSYLLDYLLGLTTIDDRLHPFAELWEGDLAWDRPGRRPHPEACVKELPKQVQRLTASGRATVLRLVGPRGCGKRALGKAVCQGLGRKMLTVDCGELLTSAQDFGTLLRLVHRESLLQDAVLYFRNTNLLSSLGSGDRAFSRQLEEIISEGPSITILAGELPWDSSLTNSKVATVIVEIPQRGHSERKLLWRDCLSPHAAKITDEDLNLLATRFQFSERETGEAVTAALNQAIWRNPEDPTITLADFLTSAKCKSIQGQRLSVQESHSGYSWDDLVLPEDRKRQLIEVCSSFLNMSRVYGQWGFERKNKLGKGLNVLLVGSSGTGKTMAAEVMSNALGLDLRRIDLSGIVSKYVGETEKNLEAIFQEAQASNQILLFDEADALFGKRAEVRDSHDRYANIEVSYLLQKMEEHQGIAILTTNLRNNMDEAFLRRLHFVVEFPYPDDDLRLEIWRRVFPSEAPLDSDVDLAFMARQFRLAGGNIKNMAVAAAFLAALDESSIGMKHLVQAARREYQKMGKLLSEQDFGPYFELALA